MHKDLPVASGRAPITWLSNGLAVDLQSRDPRSPKPDLTPLVGFLGTPILLVFTVLGIHLGATGADLGLRVLATLGGACGLMLGQALVYGAAVLLDEWSRRRERCQLEINPNRIRVWQGRKLLLDAPPSHVTSWGEGPGIDLVGLGEHVQLFTAHDPDLAAWLVGQVRTVRSQSRTMTRPTYAAVRALDQVLRRVNA
ncbi:MAG: hypothetical protein AAGA48_10365 [Myxococcota bacterium]